MRVRVCACAPHFAEVSKMAQDAPRAGAKEHKHQSDHHHRNTSDHHKHKSRSAATGARASERAHQQAPEHARIKRNYKNNSKLIFF